MVLLRVEDRELWNEYAENLSHWQKSGHRYFPFATLFIYSIWVLHTVGISGGSQLLASVFLDQAGWSAGLIGRRVSIVLLSLICE